MATHECRILATLLIKDDVEEERIKELMTPYLATQGTTYDAERERGHLEFDCGTLHLDMPVTGRGGYRNEPLEALAAGFSQAIDEPGWVEFLDLDAAGSEGAVTPYFIGATQSDKDRARINYGIEQMELWVKPVIGRKRFEVLSRLIHKAPELVDFLELVGRMTTNEEMGGDMSGDDACSTVSQIIETARGLFGIEVVEAEC
ncbi:MAG: hypothetical protein KJZ92_14045 [Rhodocyclaceae bacterium]|nr:hypothetical protein [Rhodocyclaceae bacterium]